MVPGSWKIDDQDMLTTTEVKHIVWEELGLLIDHARIIFWARKYGLGTKVGDDYRHFKARAHVFLTLAKRLSVNRGRKKDGGKDLRFS